MTNVIFQRSLCPVLLGLGSMVLGIAAMIDSDRQWFKAKRGLDATQTPRDISFCGHAILQDDIFEVPDALLDPRFAGNPLVVDAPQIRFYAGIPLRLKGGENVVLCA